MVRREYFLATGDEMACSVEPGGPRQMGVESLALEGMSPYQIRSVLEALLGAPAPCGLGRTLISGDGRLLMELDLEITEKLASADQEELRRAVKAMLSGEGEAFKELLQSCEKLAELARGAGVSRLHCWIAP